MAAFTSDGEALGGRLYRAVVVSAAEWSCLSRGLPLTWLERPVDCWSRSEMSILHLLRTRVDQRLAEGDEGAVGIVITRDFRSEDVILDVEEEGRHLGMNLPGAGGYLWHAYAAKEAEVIVRNPPGPVIIRPEEIVGAWGPDKNATLFAPRAGESVFIENEEFAIEEIVGVDEATGTIKVSAGGRTVGLIWDRSGFELGASIDAFESPSPM